MVALRNWVRALSYVDVALWFTALFFSVWTIAYPFGRDQGLYHYVGREWLHGALPYRDTMDQKTPLIYAVYALSTLLFGDHMRAIRIVELCWVLFVGPRLAVAASPLGTRPAPGMRGAASLILALLYYGMLGFWDTAQCEIWYAGLAICSLAHVQSARSMRAAATGAGLWAGMAMLAKPPAAFFVMVVGLALITRDVASTRGRPARARALSALASGALFGASVAPPLLLVLAYFAARGGLEDLYDVVVRCNSYYRQHEQAALAGLEPALARGRIAWDTLYPLSLLATLPTLVALLHGVRTRRWAPLGRHALALAFPLAGYAAVVLQQMYFLYHFGAAFAATAVPLAFAAQDLATLVPTRWAPAPRASAISLVAALLVLCAYTSAGEPVRRYRSDVATNAAFMFGRIDARAHARHYDLPGWYSASDNLAIGKWLRAHTKPGERVAMRGFEPAMYAIAQRSSGLRFFWTSWLTAPNRAYRREEWLQQDRAQLERDPPRFVVLIAGVPGPDGVEYFSGFRLQHHLHLGGLDIYEVFRR